MRQRPPIMTKRCLALAFALGCWPSPAEAGQITVGSISALQSAVNAATRGDVIVLADGEYANSILGITTSGITVRAATPGGVYLNGTNAITISGNAVTFSGFQFTSGSIPGVVVTVTGDSVVLSQLTFSGYAAQKYITLQGQYDEVSYCHFENKPTTAPAGNLVHIAPNGIVPNYARIRYCSFINMPGAGGDNGNECIRVANGAQSTYLCRTVIEYCYFENTGPGDSEVISVKSRENVIRFCTNKNNQGGNFCFRNGNDNVAYGNFFISAGGIRVKEANNIYCYNNYFENCGDGSITAPVKYVYVSPNLSNINFVHNTFVGGTPIELATGATNNTWANNIFKKTTGSIFTGSASGITWAGNIRSGTLGITVASGMTNVDPQLELNADGYYGPGSSSPAIDAASPAYPAIPDVVGIDDDPTLLEDIGGQPRPATATLKDVGCDEVTSGPTVRRPLAISDVGPSYRGGPALSVELLGAGATVSGCEVRLHWTTMTETDNYGFSIDRRPRQGSDEEWITVGIVQGSGTGTARREYAFEDSGLRPGRYAYRIRQIDRTGRMRTVFETELEVSSLPLASAEVDAYPNPFNPSTVLRCTVPVAGHAVLRIIDLQGREVEMLANEEWPTGIHVLTWDASRLSGGVYFCEFTVGSHRSVRRLLLLR